MKRKIAAVVTASALMIGLGAAVAAPANAGIQLWDHDNYRGDYLGDSAAAVTTWAVSPMTVPRR